MGKLRRYVCGTVFLLLCLGTVLFLRGFTQAGTVYQYLPWQSAAVTDENGNTEPFDLQASMMESSGAKTGCTYTFTTVLESPPQDGYLVFETSGAEITLTLDGIELFRSVSGSPWAAETLGREQVQIPLTQNTAGQTLTLSLKPIVPEGIPVFPPLMRVTSLAMEGRDVMAYANLYALPTGALALALVLVSGLFLLGLSDRRANWSLLALILALAVMATHRIAIGCGYYFFSPEINSILVQDWLWLLPSACILIYLLLNRKREFWRQLGQISLWAFAALLVVYLISLLRQGYLADYVRETVVNLFLYGSWRDPIYWLTIYLAGACALIAARALIRSIAKMQAETQMLTLKNQLALDSCRAMEQSSRRTAVLRHELKNDISALHSIYRQGNLAELGRRLAELDQLQSTLIPARYTDNFLVNAILQDAAARAGDAGIFFEAYATVPEKLGITEQDMSSLLMNVLDNALEAAGKVEPAGARSILFRAEVKNGFLAVSCKNSYDGTLRTDEQGAFLTTKAEQDAHGFGLRQMRAVAEKYNSMLDVSYTEDSFIVRTALKLAELK
jgi:hypothetical protein